MIYPIKGNFFCSVPKVQLTRFQVGYKKQQLNEFTEIWTTRFSALLPVLFFLTKMGI